MRHFELIPEDNAMALLVHTLGFHQPNYANGIGDTLNKIEKHFKNKFAIGVVDDDWRKPNLFLQYERLLIAENSLELRQKPNSRHFLIVVYPAIEDWILENASLCEMSNTGFDDRESIMRVTKDEVEIIRNSKFRQFMHKLHQADAPGFVTMGKWIADLYQKHF